MKKVFVFIPILMSSLSLVSCGPVDFLPPINSLENTVSIIEPEKELYTLSEDIKLYYSFDLNPEKFYEHEYYVSTRILKNGKEEICDEKVLVYDENENNVTSQRFTFSITESKKITKQFTLKPQEAGDYIISAGGFAYTKEKEKRHISYECNQVHYLNVQEGNNE